MPAHGRVLPAVFQDIEQGLRRPVRIAAAAGGGIPVIKQGLGFQLDRDEERGRGLFEQGADRYRFQAERDHAGVELGHLQQRRDQPLDPFELGADPFGEFLPFRGGKLCVLEQVGHDHHGGQRRLELMGDIGEGVGKLGFFPLQQAGVFREHDRHFVEFALQNAQFALLVVPHVQGVFPGRYPLEIARQLPDLPVTPVGEQHRDAAGEQPAYECGEPGGGSGEKADAGADQQAGEQDAAQPADLPVAEKAHASASFSDFVSQPADGFDDGRILRIVLDFFPQPLDVNGQGVVVDKIPRHVPDPLEQLGAGEDLPLVID